MIKVVTEMMYTLKAIVKQYEGINGKLILVHEDLQELIKVMKETLSEENEGKDVN